MELGTVVAVKILQWINLVSYQIIPVYSYAVPVYSYYI